MRGSRTTFETVSSPSLSLTLAEYLTATQQMRLTFNRNLAASTIANNRLTMRGVDASPRRNQGAGTISAQVLTLATNAGLGDNSPPPRLEYTAGAGDITADNGSTLPLFTGFPVTVI